MPGRIDDLVRRVRSFGPETRHAHIQSRAQNVDVMEELIEPVGLNLAALETQARRRLLLADVLRAALLFLFQNVRNNAAFAAGKADLYASRFVERTQFLVVVDVLKAKLSGFLQR